MAHTIRGALSMLAVRGVEGIARELEELTHSGTVSGAEAAIGELTKDLPPVFQLLTDFAEGRIDENGAEVAS